MRYNTYRQYKTLSGYDDRREKISTVIQYVEKNYQFQYQAYDLIKSIPSGDFDQYVKGKVIKILLRPDFYVESIGVYDSIDDPLEDKLYDVPYEPNSFIYSVNDPELHGQQDPDDYQDVTVKILDSNFRPQSLFKASDGSILGSSLVSADDITFASRINYNDIYTNNMIYVLTYNLSNSHTETYHAQYGSAHIEIDIIFDSNDTQENIANFPVYVPKFVPVE